MNKLFLLTLISTLRLSVHATKPDAVLKHYADLAHAMYSDALPTAKRLQQTIDTLLAKPTEAYVATGHHAIEFLLWGRDLNGKGPGAGARPVSDFDTARCSRGHFDRRAAYLKAATDLLLEDLQWMVDQWAAGGQARAAVTSGDPNKNLAIIFTGMGSLSYGELAGERMKLGLMLHDPEKEHDCFSDNTHWSHYSDELAPSLPCPS